MVGREKAQGTSGEREQVERSGRERGRAAGAIAGQRRRWAGHHVKWNLGVSRRQAHRPGRERGKVRTALICYDGSLVPARRSSQAWVEPFASFFGWTSGHGPPGDGRCCSSRTKPCPSTGHKCEMVSGRIKSLGRLGWGGLFRLEPIFVRC